jgi:hypothetical protein
MKTVRTFSIFLAVVMLVTAIVPFAATPAAAMETTPPTFTQTSFGLPFYAPAGLIAPSLAPAYSAYSCALVNQNPKDWVKMKPRQSFDMIWTVQNTGATWNSNYIQLKYLWGAKMQTHGDLFGIDNNVGRGKKLKLGIDMIAPKNPGTYPITWGLYNGNTRICILTFIVTVVR